MSAPYKLCSHFNPAATCDLSHPWYERCGLSLPGVFWLAVVVVWGIVLLLENQGIIP